MRFFYYSSLSSQMIGDVFCGFGSWEKKLLMNPTERFFKSKKILQGLRKNLLGRIGATFVTSLSAHQSRGRDFSPASAISRNKPCREGCEDNGPRWVCPKNEKTNGFVVLFVFLSWSVIERSVNIIIDRRRVAKNVDWLQIDREYLVDIGDK